MVMMTLLLLLLLLLRMADLGVLCAPAAAVDHGFVFGIGLGMVAQEALQHHTHTRDGHGGSQYEPHDHALVWEAETEGSLHREAALAIHAPGFRGVAVDVKTDGRTDGRTDGWSDGWVDGLEVGGRHVRGNGLLPVTATANE